MFKKLKRLVKRIDVFGSPILLKHKGKSYYHSWVGGIVTMLTILAVTGLVVHLLIYFLTVRNE